MNHSQKSQRKLDNKDTNRKVIVGILALLAISSMVLIVLAGNPIRMVNVIKDMSLIRYSFAVAILIVAESLRAFRLKVLVEKSGRKLNFIHCLLARFLGKFASAITPGGLGGSPTRASIVGSYSQTEIGESIGITLLETFSDTIWPSIFLIFLPLAGLISWVMISISVLIASLWVLGVLVASSYNVAKKLYNKFRIPRKMICRIERQRLLFIHALKRIKDIRLLIIIILLTILSHMIEAYGILVLEGLWDLSFLHSMSYLKALAAVEAGYVLVSIPTPGGSGGVEYGLYLFLGSTLAIRWRVVQLTVALLPGIFLVIITPKVLHYIKETSFPEVDSCENEA